MNQADDDPTIICNMLEEFRANANSYYRSSMLPTSISLQNDSASSSGRLRRLTFDSSNRSQSEFAEKRIKLTTPKTSETHREAMSPWEMRRLKSEMIKSRTQVIEAEERLSKLQGLKLETEMLYAREKKALEKALQEERQKVSDLENRLEFIRKREAETIERCQQTQSGENNRKTQQILSELQQENITLKEQLFESNKTIENLKNQEKNEINKMSNDLEMLRKENDANLQVIESLRNELSEKSNDLRKLEMEQSKLLNVTKRVKDLESEREMYQETRLYVESQSKKLLRFSELERELAEAKDEITRLKSSISNTMYLEEIVEDLKKRDKQRANIEQEIIQLRTENQCQRSELDNWCDLAKYFCATSDENVKPFMMVKMRLEELIKKELFHISELKNSELRCEHLKKTLAEKENKLLEYQKQFEESKASLEAYASNTKRLKKQLTLLSWERNDLRNLLDSCQKEMTINSETHNQLDTLQRVIENYKQRIEQIENDPSLAATGIASKGQLNSTERDDFSKQEMFLKEENRKLQEKILQLNEKIQQLSDQLEYRNLKGDFDPRQTKIIHFKANPTTEAVQNYVDRLTKANEEICRLQERIKVMEEGNDEDVTRIVEERVQTSAVKEVNELKERVKSLEIQNQRLCEVFKKKTHDFREAMYMMFGYRIDVLSSNQYRLRNQYAFDSDDILLFQTSQANGSSMELLETPFSQSLSELIDLHLKQHQSIPVFLASVTIDLFNKQTITTFSAMESTLSAE